MVTTLIVLHVVICVLLIVTVLLQFGKGAEAGAIMGGGASQAVFSSSAKGNFMTKLTTVLAVGFFINSIILTTIKSHESRRSLFDNEAPVAAPLNSDMEDLNKKQQTAPVTGKDTPASPTATVPATTTPAPETKPVTH
ncbi:MAG: preprotein translocase subunit SecG [Bacteriovoracaceae bacterium]